MRLRGFTLPEALVAIAITSAVLVGLMTAQSAFVRALSKMHSAHKAYELARAVNRVAVASCRDPEMVGRGLDPTNPDISRFLTSDAAATPQRRTSSIEVADRLSSEDPAPLAEFDLVSPDGVRRPVATLGARCDLPQVCSYDVATDACR